MKTFPLKIWSSAFTKNRMEQNFHLLKSTYLDCYKNNIKEQTYLETDILNTVRKSLKWFIADTHALSSTNFYNFIFN